MEIKQLSLISAMSGKLNKKQKVVFSTRYGKVHAWEVNAYTGPWTDAQKMSHEVFALAQTRVNEVLADPTTKAPYVEMFKLSRGKYKTLRGLIFASVYPSVKQEVAASHTQTA